MAIVSNTSGKKFLLGRGTILLMLVSLLVSALLSFGAVKIFFSLKAQAKANTKAQAVRREEERNNREQEAKERLEQVFNPRVETYDERAAREHREMEKWEREVKRKTRDAIENLDYIMRQERYRNRK